MVTFSSVEDGLIYIERTYENIYIYIYIYYDFAGTLNYVYIVLLGNKQN